jgi:DNA-directed RNA polymerase subunit F
MGGQIKNIMPSTSDEMKSIFLVTENIMNRIILKIMT